jgi:hypothetical protein
MLDESSLYAAPQGFDMGVVIENEGDGMQE